MVRHELACATAARAGGADEGFAEEGVGADAPSAVVHSLGMGSF
jgi:hypothetical protein